jgi:mannonate dehydratase
MSDEAPLTPPPPPRKLLTRRRFLGALAGGGALAVGYPLAWISPPPKLDDLTLSDAAQALVAKAWLGLDPTRVVDGHVHVLGLGVGGTGCYVHPDASSWTSPVRMLKTRFYKGAAGVYDDARADELFVERLVDLWSHQHPRGKALLLAFDANRDTSGHVVPAMTEFYVPNEYVASLVQRYPDDFLYCCSVHPYRPDALDELRRCAAAGAVACKWLPNAMGIDPADPRCDPFYELLAELKITLLSHTGEEQAVHAEELQELGNPLRLRRALDRGATVVMAHCACLGEGEDLDAEPDASGQHPKVPSLELFLRLMEDERYTGRLFADISATTQFNRAEPTLRELLTRPHLHARLVNGSDYPLPAIDPLIRTGQLVDLGFLDPAERPAINELYDYNPLTFDFVLKRRLRLQQDGAELRFASTVFESADVYRGRG